MGYYTIMLSPSSQDITKTVTEFGKFGYNHLPMGMCASGYIFQAKLYKIIGDIKGVKTYIDDILVFSKDFFRNHIEQRRIIFGRLSVAGLKFNAPGFSFWLKENLYLGYVITRGGIKPEPKKVKDIMYLG